MENSANKKNTDGKVNEEFPGYPASSPKDDIYYNEKEVPLPDDTDPAINDGLDVPGSELDDSDEITGNEDEENNAYSIGGDRHHDLDENQE